MSAELMTADKIIQNRGKIAYNPSGFTNAETTTFEPLRHGLPQVDAGYRHCQAVVAGNEIRLKGVATDDVSTNAVNVLYQADSARFGWLNGPGIIYSDSFSGCAFYLFRSQTGGKIFGVHASRQSGRLIDPIPTFRQAGYKLIWFWDSLGALSDQQLLANSFAGVFCYVDTGTIATYAVRLKGQNVEAVLSRTFIPSYHAFDLPDPVIPATRPVPVSALQRLKNILHV